jgi:magnesium chelatase family protein
LSGPILDRFDLSVATSKPEVDEVLCSAPAESSEAVSVRVATVRDMARSRGVRTNADLPFSALEVVKPLTTGAAQLLERRLRSADISARGLHRIRRVALTVSDLEDASAVDENHIAEALHLRSARETLLPQ